MKAIGIILAGGNNDGRLGVLTDHRAAAALPIGSCYRAIDFTLSNMSNSGIGKVAVLTQYNSRSLRLVVYIAKKFENTGVGLDDLVSIGTIGLIKAVNTFSVNRNIKLATYASRCIENEILMYLRKTSQRRCEISIDEPLNVDWDGNELLLSDVLGTDSDCVNARIEDETEKKLLHDAVNHLTPRERQIMEMRFGLKGGREKTQKEVADEIGISQSYISRLEKRIIKQLREELERVCN